MVKRKCGLCNFVGGDQSFNDKKLEIQAFLSLFARFFFYFLFFCQILVIDFFSLTGLFVFIHLSPCLDIFDSSLFKKKKSIVFILPWSQCLDVQTWDLRRYTYSWKDFY